MGLAPTPLRAEVVNRIIATIDGEPITAHELERFAKERRVPDPADPRVLEALITDRLLDREIQSKGISAKPEDIDRYIEGVRERNGMTEEQFDKALREQGLTKDAFRARVKAEIEKNELVQREVRGRVNVSPQEIERYYEAHREDYEAEGGDGGVTVSDIFLPVPAGDPGAAARVAVAAQELAGMARQGDFAEVAKQYSQGPGAAEGGQLGTFTKGQLEPALDAVVWKLKKGEVSDPVRTAQGFHILRVDRIRTGSGGKTRELDAELRDEIRESLYSKAIESRFQEFLTKGLRERHHVEVFN